MDLVVSDPLGGNMVSRIPCHFQQLYRLRSSWCFWTVVNESHCLALMARPFRLRSGFSSSAPD